jgi:hypothetical protein
LRINAWTGDEAGAGALDPRADRWGSRGGLPPAQQALDLGAPADPTAWSRDDVGYGVLLPESDHPVTEKAVGSDAAAAVQELLAARPGAVMLRWDTTLPPGFLRRYFPDGSSQTPNILSPYGTAKGCLPRYILIVGGPEAIPWHVQYTFGTRRAVGRLPLEGDALTHYVSAMLSDWAGCEVDVRAPLQWTVDLPGDITAEMRAVIADPLEVKLTDPQLPRFEHLTDDRATGAELLARLTAAKPGLVVTSSHGLTAGDRDAMGKTLGLPVDVRHDSVDLDALDAAMPAGCVWYAQACCSAGSEAPTKYAGLLGAGTPALTVVSAVADLGSTVAPAALRLLGREQPVRAVLGHVEPTFDWTLRVAETGQGLGAALVAALSTNLLGGGQPLGYAFSDYRLGVGDLHADWLTAFDSLNAGDLDQRPKLTRLRLTAFDRQSLVLLGDPTVKLPSLNAAP